MIIDTHAHFTPDILLKAFATKGHLFPNIELLEEEGKFRLSFMGKSPTRPLAPKLCDSDMRIDWMDRQSIDKQVVGGWLDSFGYNLPPREGESWSRFLNEYQIIGTQDTDRLYPLASVPLQSGFKAAKVMEEAILSGAHGVMIGTQPHGEYGNLDSPDLEPFWEAADSLGATIYIHPMFGCGDTRLNDYGMMNAVGRGLDTTTAVSRMLFGGYFTRFSRLKCVISHGGGALPFLMGRLKRNHEIHPEECADPAIEFRKLYFDSVLFQPDALTFLCSCCGHDRVVLGSDYPFPIGDMAPLDVINKANFDNSQKHMILGETAQKLFKIN